MSFSAQLKRVMGERELTQARLSALSGIGKPSISGYVSGAHTPSDKHREKLAAALDVSVDYFNDTANVSETNDDKPLLNLSVERAAELMGKSQQFVRVSLQNGVAP